jgi:hypothetical protein
MIRPMRCSCVILLFASVVSAQQITNPPTKSRNAAAVAEAQETEHAASPSVNLLPIRRVVLYKNGVGYFEHVGSVRGSEDVHIDFTSAQLNDVLKSLTVLDLSGGRITGVDYNSEAPLARRLATLRLALGERPTQSEFLGALRGARLEVRTGTAPPITGKLLSVERKTRSSAQFTAETDEISLISDSGEVRSADLSPATSVRILDHDLAIEVGRYLGLVASAREQDVRRMTISTTGTGQRNLYVSYISEVPLWKTTYRIVLPTSAEKKPLLQGWAIIDNTVGEDWNNVDLSLVAGAPHSFIQQLSEPYYGRRPEVPLPESVQLSPQTHGATLSGGNGRLSGQVTDPSGAAIPGAAVQLLDEKDDILSSTNADSLGNYAFAGIPPGQYKAEFNAPGFQRTVVSQVNLEAGDNIQNSRLNIGSATQTVEVSASGATLETSSATVEGTPVGGKLPVANRAHASGNEQFGVGGGVGGGMVEGIGMASRTDRFKGIEAAREAMSAAASGQDLGDLFEYKLKDRVTLKKNQSALVPIAQTEIQADRVSLWTGTSGSGRPLRALWVKNTSALTLDGGSFNILDQNVFAGEGLTETIKPGERRLLSYATDLGLLVEASRVAEPQHVTKVKISKGTMTQTHEERSQTTYTVKNQDDAQRTLIIEHPAAAGSTLAKGTLEPEERAPGVYRFKMEIAPKATASLPVEDVRVQQTFYQVANLSNDQIAVFSSHGSITPEMAAALKKISAQKAVVTQLEQTMEDRQKDIDRIVDDQQRLRENMKALKGSAEEKALLQRYTHQLDQQETELETLRKTIRDAEAKRDEASAQLDQMVADLNLEADV